MIDSISALPPDAVLECDVAVVGGGPAGIALALALAGSPLRVVVLEAGGRTLDAREQAFAVGLSTGIPYFPLHESRYRLLGGSTFRWGARTAPLKPIDLAPRDWVPHSGWPFDRTELEPHYANAYELIGLHQPFRYEGDVWQQLRGTPPPFDPARLEYVAFQFGKSVLFAEAHRERLVRAPNVRVWLDAPVHSIVPTARGDRVDHLRLHAHAGAARGVRARTYVLAAGGIENARLLLLSDAIRPEGLGNAHGMVGRCFMEHPTVSAGRVVAARWQKLHDACSPGLVRGRLVEVGLALAPALQAEARCLDAVVRTTLEVGRDPTQALRELLWNLRHRRLPHQLDWYQKNRWLKERLGAIARDPFAIVANLARHAAGRPKRFKVDAVHLEVRIEQAPNPESRVTLDDSLDARGQRRVRLHWSLTPQDKHTMRVAATTFAAELERLGLGRLELDPALASDGPELPDGMVGGHHHMGTTRIAADAREGVVDAHCRVHGIDNLHVAGTSVFPTAGYVNPTATMLALALRLARHLRQVA